MDSTCYMIWFYVEKPRFEPLDQFYHMKDKLSYKEVMV